MLVLVLFGLVSGAAAAEERVRVFQLENRPATEVRTMLQPLIPDSVALSTTGFKLLARGPQAELERIASLVEELDKAAMDIIVETRRARTAENNQSGGRVGGSVDDDEARFRAEVYDTEKAAKGDRTQSARGLAGTPIYINQALEVPVRDTDVSIGRERTGVRSQTHYRRMSQGFYATASVSGERVRVEIASADDSLADDQAATRRRVVTTVSGKLGEWLLIGSTGTQEDQAESGITYRTRDKSASDSRLWIRVRQAE